MPDPTERKPFDLKEATKLTRKDWLGIVAVALVVFVLPAAYVIHTHGWAAMLTGCPYWLPFCN